MNNGNQERPWEDGIAALLEDLSEVQDQLLDVLTKKRERMAVGDLEGMAELDEVEQALCARLQAVHDRRAILLREAGEQGLPAEGLGDLAGAVSPSDQGALRKRVDQASSRMQLLQHHTVSNWVVAQMALLHASKMLEIIATGGQFQPTYGKAGNPDSCGVLVDQEV